MNSIATQLIKDGKVTNSGRAGLGVTVRPFFDANFQPAGAAIVSVTSGGPAASAGLQAGDVITKVNDTTITSPSVLTSALASFSPGDKVTVGYQRDGKNQTADVTLGSL